ncbi:MAG: hypothetical protein PHF84_10475 [bacterium]|nr:hypothetical protein [bacterium]
MKKIFVLILIFFFLPGFLTAEIKFEVYPFRNKSSFKNRFLSTESPEIFCEQLRNEKGYTAIYRKEEGMDLTKDTPASNQPVLYKLNGSIEKCSLAGYGVITPGMGGFSHYSARVIVRIEVYSNKSRIMSLTGEGVKKDNSLGLTVFGGPGTSEEVESLVFKELQARSLRDREFRDSILGKAFSLSMDDAVKKIRQRFQVRVEVSSGTKNYFEVLDKEGDTVYINAGHLDFIKAGDQLNVYKLGRELKSPDTGKVLGNKEDYCGKVRVMLVLSDNLLKAKIIDGKAKIAKNDRVRK